MIKTNEAFLYDRVRDFDKQAFDEYGLKTVCPMPCNTYGTNDHFDLQKSHVLSSLIKKIIDAKIVNKKSINMLGTGKAVREFMHVDDAARGILFFLENSCQ